MDLMHLVKQMPGDVIQLAELGRARTLDMAQAVSSGQSNRERLNQEAIAKDFESIFITHLLGEMKKSIGQWGLDQDGTSEQIQDLFWTFLGQEAGRQGGIGLWKDIYRSMLQIEKPSTQTLDANL